MNDSDKNFNIRRNLIDAGCPNAEIEKFLNLYEQGLEREMQDFLTRHRSALLDTVHVNQRRIDCLDFLIYEMNRTNNHKTSKTHRRGDSK